MELAMCDMRYAISLREPKQSSDLGTYRGVRILPTQVCRAMEGYEVDAWSLTLTTQLTPKMYVSEYVRTGSLSSLGTALR